MQRRNFMQMLMGVTAAWLLVPLSAIAAIWNKVAFEAVQPGEAIQALGIVRLTLSPDIDIVAPDIAENGAVVQVEATSRIAGTQAIMIVAEKNPTPLIASFSFSNGAQPFVITRIKMAESCALQIIVKAGDQYYSASKHVEVLADGCN